MERLTVRDAMMDLREEFLGEIFKDYEHGKKSWDHKEIQNALHCAMYAVAMDYLGREDKENEKPSS